MAPLGAQAADLVVWGNDGYYPEEHEAVEEIVPAFEQKSGKQVELLFCPQGDGLPTNIEGLSSTIAGADRSRAILNWLYQTVTPEPPRADVEDGPQPTRSPPGARAL